MSKIRKQSKKKIYAGLIGAAAASILCSGYLLYDWKSDKDSRDLLESRHEMELAEVKKQLLTEQEENQTGYVTIHDIPSGTPLKDSDVRAVKVPKGQAPDNLMKELDEIPGRIAKIELKAGTALTSAMIYEEKPTPADLRNREISVIQLPSLLSAGDRIDVRIQFPTGQDYIVLSKKKVEDLNGATMWMTLNEEEILTLSSAMVDAYLHKASLYSLTYVEPEFQDRAIPTYPSNEKVLQLIESNPNIVDRAERALASQLRVSLEQALSETASYAVSESIENDLVRSNVSSSLPNWTTDSREDSTAESPSNEEIWKGSSGSSGQTANSDLEEQNEILSQPFTAKP
ncbi:SAF domain-containing protein [Neobacillus mesonae]|nr:SAF domain-containing protein [Neobacillus mesonae]